MIRNNRGFSLIELMVAMVVGLVIILGAGQLFLTVFTNNQRVDTLGEKQATVNFATETLLRDIRRADWDDKENTKWDSDKRVLSLSVKNYNDVSSGCGPGDDVVKKYKLKEREGVGETEWFMAVEMSSCEGKPLGGGYQEVVSGFISGAIESPGFEIVSDDVDDWDNGIVKVIFRLVPTGDESTPDPLEFFAVNRTMAVKRIDNDDDDDSDDDDDDENDENEDDGGSNSLIFCKGTELSGKAVQNDKDTAVFSFLWKEAECPVSGSGNNAEYSCVLDIPRGAWVSVTVTDKNGKKSRKEWFRIGLGCGVSGPFESKW